ncbi:MAG: Fis family transcriptional regulator [Desulfobacterales bacterium CG2_30_60_27]|nr:MAG: Fis family transcriptional regulator [Desulfobacterales bacterium CG2_30_60_27]
MAAILIVDDERSMREFLKILLEKAGHAPVTVGNGAAAVQALQGQHFDLVISDIRMPGMNGLDLLARIKEIDPGLPVVLITAYASPNDAVIAMRSGAYDYLTKPFKVEEIERIVTSALVSAATPQKEESTGMAGIIGDSPEMLKIFDQIRQVAPTHANVIIYGESGTGKELVAKAIHQLSRVATRPFMPIICNAIPESLFESELFGHVKGAFTGATANKTGLLEAANNGSVFLDEIGELPLMIQTKLLRVLQEREFKPVGGTETVKINVRIICATNKDLEGEVMAGRFREDLFYRLAVVPIRVPSLRERKSDIPMLIDYFLRKYSEMFDKQVSAISSYAMEVLMDYDFPGNVRELENIIERGVAMESSNIILPESLTLATHRREMARQQAEPAARGLDEAMVFDLGLEEVLARQEKHYIEQALAKSNNSKMQAAELLKMSFRSLRYKIKKYGIDT